MQNDFMEFIESSFDDNRQVIVDKIYLFLLSENRFFSLKHSQIRPTNNPVESEILEIEISCSKSWAELRIRLLRNLFKLYDKYPIEVEDVFEDYLNNIFNGFNSIYENEEEIVFKFLSRLDYTKYKANKLLYNYLKEMGKCGVDLKNNYDFIDDAIIEYIQIYSNILNPNSLPGYPDKVDEISEKLKKKKS